MNTDTNSIKRFIPLIIIGVVLVIAVLIYSFSTKTDQNNKVKVQVDVIPTSATITANGEEISQGTTYLAAGTYDVTATSDGFQEETQKITVDTDHPYIQMLLTAVSEEAKAYEKSHAVLYTDYEAKVGAASRQVGELFKQKNPITKLLPVDKLVYKIGYTSPDNNTITLTIHAITGYQRKAALQQISDWGYDPTDYKITFVNFSNPLE